MILPAHIGISVARKPATVDSTHCETSFKFSLKKPVGSTRSPGMNLNRVVANYGHLTLNHHRYSRKACVSSTEAFSQATSSYKKTGDTYYSNGLLNIILKSQTFLAWLLFYNTVFRHYNYRPSLLTGAMALAPVSARNCKVKSTLCGA